MKNVAVLGCSHSSERTHDRMWPVQLAERYPNLNIINYSMPGHGHYYMDIILKHLMYESEEQIDWIIVQFTGFHRHHNPILCSKTDPMFRSSLAHDTHLPKNYNALSLCTSRRIRIHTLDADSLEDFGTISTNGAHDHKPNEGVYSEAEYFTRLFQKQVIDMAKYLPLSCFTIWDRPNVDNIGMKESFWAYINRTYNLNEHLDESGHFNDKANTILVNYLEGLPLFSQHLR